MNEMCAKRIRFSPFFFVHFLGNSLKLPVSVCPQSVNFMLYNLILLSLNRIHRINFIQTVHGVNKSDKMEFMKYGLKKKISRTNDECANTPPATTLNQCSILLDLIGDFNVNDSQFAWQKIIVY